MKLQGVFLALSVKPIVDLACAKVVGGNWRPSAVRAGMTMFAEEAVFDVGVAQVHAIAHGDEQVGKNLIEKLQADGQATGEMPSPLVRVKHAVVQPGIKSSQKFLTRRDVCELCSQR